MYIRPWPPGWSFLRRIYTSRGSERVNNNNSSNCLHVDLRQSCSNIEKGGCCVVCQISAIRTKLLLYHQPQLV